MRIRGNKIGTRRIDRHLVEGVNLDAIPRLDGRVRVFSIDEVSQSGMAPKNVVCVDGNVRYIAKRQSKKNSGPVECVTEYLISRIGRTLPLAVAEGRLAMFPLWDGGPPTLHFMSRVFIRDPERQQLLHGVEVAALCFELDRDVMVKEIPPWSQAERTFYTVDLIDELLAKIARSPTNLQELQDAFARMMAFDALVGANDRHPENWGLVVDPTGAAPPRLAPVYDTARGLFWQWEEERLKREEVGGRREEVIERYAFGSQPLITADGLGKKPNHFAVIEKMVALRPAFSRAARAIVSAFHPDTMARTLHAEFRRLLSRRRLEFIDTLLRMRYRYLRAACGLSPQMLGASSWPPDS